MDCDMLTVKPGMEQSKGLAVIKALIRVQEIMEEKDIQLARNSSTSTRVSFNGRESTKNSPTHVTFNGRESTKNSLRPRSNHQLESIMSRLESLEKKVDQISRLVSLLEEEEREKCGDGESHRNGNC